MPIDFKKIQKELYLPKNRPEIITVPPMRFVAVDGQGDPNEEGGEYKGALEVLYAVSYTLKMSYKTGYKIPGFYEYVVPPLEGFWVQPGTESFDYSDKSSSPTKSGRRITDVQCRADLSL